jgi:HAD superfamily hydrolase (TIGR01484 family)
MQFQALATDYDGTIAHEGVVAPEVLKSLKRLKGSGRKLILVTGRELTELMSVFREITLFDSVVVENGAVLYNPQSREKKALGHRPTEAFVEALKKRGVDPISLGKVMVATHQPHESTVLQVIQEMGLELSVAFNKGAVMILPSGINKGTGLRAALAELKLSRHHVVGVGDAENDHAFLSLCEVAAAVGNALPAVKDHADIVLELPNGKGVAALADELVQNDLIALRTVKPV